MTPQIRDAIFKAFDRRMERLIWPEGRPPETPDECTNAASAAPSYYYVLAIRDTAAKVECSQKTRDAILDFAADTAVAFGPIIERNLAWAHGMGPPPPNRYAGPPRKS